MPAWPQFLLPLKFVNVHASLFMHYRNLATYSWCIKHDVNTLRKRRRPKTRRGEF